jgi:hypothetical protein
MKKFYSILILLVLTSALYAQNSVRFEIIHKLHGEDFAFNKETFNDQGFIFNADRLQYYISEISVTHDGGVITEFEDVWILVNAGMSTDALLGTDSIDSIESISFHIGVDPAHNHLDHTMYSSSHPLGPKNPQMHWGWTAGYRFVAMEGDIGSELDNNYQFHALGDGNYFETTVPASAVVQNGVVRVQVYANYSNALNGLSNIEDGFVLHSEIGECITVLENFRDNVFSMEPPADTVMPVIIDTIDTTDVTGIMVISLEEINVYPNPAKNEFWIQSRHLGNGAFIEIVSLDGAVIERRQLSPEATRLGTESLLNGIYILKIQKDGWPATMNKRIVVMHE